MRGVYRLENQVQRTLDHFQPSTRGIDGAELSLLLFGYLKRDLTLLVGGRIGIVVQHPECQLPGIFSIKECECDIEYG